MSLPKGCGPDPDLFRPRHVIILGEFATRKNCLAKKKPDEKFHRDFVTIIFQSQKLKNKQNESTLEIILESNDIYIIEER